MKKEMTPEQAKTIQEAFGECSVVYEAMTLAEVLRDYNDDEGRPHTIGQWLHIRLTVEEMDGANPAMIRAIKKRLKAAGFTVTKYR